MKQEKLTRDKNSNIKMRAGIGFDRMDGIGVLCEWCLVLDEPPWRPNNRRCCMHYLLLGPEAAHAIAVYLVHNMPYS